ncbi:carbohydrate ABC transporter permease [Actinophytocola xanthii]|uniref:ABC transporter n=1 Tax=Actinophytocola xanthii TaxID=1912961 RepID=A0A1Q8CRW1_9PSEU|nr:sugar ABC transporter permease [Actinophytocola xanthii]OLF17064.1 ABC transporter [Actinophytocola xanthii]
MVAGVDTRTGEEAASDESPRPGPREPARPAVSRPRSWYLLPAALLFGLFAAFPLVLVVFLSFTEWEGIGDPALIGLDNWVRLFGDQRVLDVTGTTLLLTVLCWVTQTPAALLLGVWAAGPQRNRAILSSIFFLPLLLSTAALALMWQRLLDPYFGLATELGPLRNLLGTGTGAIAAIVFVIGWQYIPFHMLLYQAAARNVPKVLYDAATLDGASRSQMFWQITLPQLRNTIITSSTIMVVGSLTHFEIVLLLTNGGPGTATYILPFEMYIRGFRALEFGYASAIATVLVVLATTVSLVIVKFSGFAKMRSTLEGM